MRTLWMSNYRNVPTGYGNQTNLFMPALHKAGHEMMAFATYGLDGYTMTDQDGIVTVPKLRDDWGSDIILGHMHRHDAELLITLLDPWVLNYQLFGQLPWCAWTPIDSEPMLPALVPAMNHARWIWAMSRFGEEQLKQIGVGDKTSYVPHGVDTDVFKPVNREEAKGKIGKYLGVDLSEKFLVAINAANKGAPSRKGFYEMFSAFKAFSDEHERAMLYVHSDREGQWYGENLLDVAELVKLDLNKVIFVPEYPYHMGQLWPPYLNDVYNAADVFLHLSRGEGFGIPIIEAQASGCPVIVTDGSAMSELCLSGFKVRGRPFMHVPGSTLQLADVTMAKLCLDLVYEDTMGSGAPLRVKAREGALAYDHRVVLSKYMMPAMEKIAEEIEARKASQVTRADKREAARNGAGHVHDWSPTGLWVNGEMWVPCRDPKCEAYQAFADRAEPTIHQSGFGTTINGIALDIEDDPQGGVAKIVCQEIAHDYDLDSIPFAPGDVVIDVGAQVGIVSIYLAKRHPEITIYAFEPIPENFERLLRNLKANDVKNVTAINQAITCDGRDLMLYGDLGSNSGGISAFTGEVGPRHLALSMTLDDVLKAYGIKRVKLLKIDCEGAEYEILTDEVLAKVDHLRGELHTNSLLTAKGYSPDAMHKKLVESGVGFHWQVCQIAEPVDDSRAAKRNAVRERVATRG
jgi:FkbM family methyltransferase